ncbi:pathogenesis-related protein 1A-like [Telopea speciosissima]|uniref:pathogenesis-related protein 1A-like n=1 Tax=Telopea speciosissima TaxID=54955 RepID=UPI001CC39BCC|nr:pathogenesis-related protein 1A-like [Telopea speciosissima]
MGEPLMKWDKSLARYARRFAAKRVADCQMIHSNGPYGENIFWGARNIFSPSQVVAEWVNEKHYYNRTDNICAANKICGHYKQVVWRDTVRVGCSMVQCLDGGAYAICSYSPPGNYRGEDPFIKHEND